MQSNAKANKVNIFAKLWGLDSDTTFLNHGSYGACPKVVLEEQDKIRRHIELDPLNFFNRKYEPLIREAKKRLGSFLSGDDECLAFLPNATTAVNTVLRSLDFSPKDELLTTNHVYNSCRNVLEFVAAKTGATLKIVDVPFPLQSEQIVTDSILKGVSDSTKIVLVDHITSDTALIFPVKKIVEELNKLNIKSLIDGSHAPGNISLNLRDIGATFYVGNCYKWLCAPRASAFLYVTKENQSLIRPLVISHGANSKNTHKSFFEIEFDWLGTTDPSPVLAIPKTLDYLEDIFQDGIEGLMKHNRELALAARVNVQKIIEVPTPCPDSFIGSMVSLPLPERLNRYSYIELRDALYDCFKIQVPIIAWGTDTKNLVRFSSQIYNTIDEYDYLAHALMSL
jgi:isopenicillin-N epimerase